MGEEYVPTQGSITVGEEGLTYTGRRGVGEGEVLTQGGAGVEEGGRTYTGRRGGWEGWTYLHKAARGGGGRTHPLPPCLYVRLFIE